MAAALSACGSSSGSSSAAGSGGGQTSASGGQSGSQTSASGGQTTASSGQKYGCGAKQLKVALVIPGPSDDHGYNAAAVAGLDAAKKKYCLQTSVTDEVSQSNSAQVVTGYAQSGYNVIIGHNEEFEDAEAQAAEQYPNVDYFVHAGDLTNNPHVQSSFLREQDAAYLNGIMAGYLTKTDKIGFVAYQPLGIVIASMNAFLKGARTVHPSIKLFHIYTNNLTDSSVAIQATRTLMSNGADVIAHINGGTNSADILQTAQSHGDYAFGFPIDQSSIAPKAVASSLLVNYPALVEDEIKEVIDGKFKGGLINYSLASGIVGIPKPAGFVPPAAVAAVKAAEKKIKSGALKIDVSSKTVSQ